jgi:carboxyl-terminal processing protease
MITRTVTVTALAGLLFFSQPMAPIFAADEAAVPAAKPEDTYRLMQLFGNVFERVRGDYVERPSDKALIESAINGMLSSLDPHSSYMNPEAFKEMQVQTKGEFGGLGIEVTMENGVVKVVSPIDDTPAARAGLQTGDLITHIDDEPVLGMNLSEAVDKMRGPVGSEIKIKIFREGSDPFDVTLLRAVITIRSVRSHLEGDIGYVRITSFNEQAFQGLDKAVKDFSVTLKKDNKTLRGLVLDLRNNPGGLLDQAVAVSDAFMVRGEVVSIRSEQHPEDAQRFNARPGDIISGLPLVVLINGGSASASEIVAGALQDQGRAIIMGTKSFGKGSVQTIIPLSGGEDGAMRMTTSRYYTPSGRSIQAVGVSPDIEVKQAKLEVLEPEAQRRERDLRGALDKENGAPKEADAPKENGADAGAGVQTGAEADAAADDYQLTRALDMIRGITLFGGATNPAGG